MLKAVLRIFAALIVLSAPSFGAEAKKYTACTITINSDDEATLFKKRLDSKQFNFVELVPAYVSGTEKTDGNWFESACERFKLSQTKCDLLIVSGHFGGSFFGSSGKRLSLETLERMGCNDACPGIMHSPKEVFMFGCNTLADKSADSRTPEQYRSILRTETNELGERIFSDAQVEEIVAFRYSEFGQSNRDRMSRAFSGVPHLYGFDSVGPLGKTARPFLNQYLDAVPNYAKHLEDIELNESVKQTQEAFEKVRALGNTAIAKAFKTTNFAQCSGGRSEDSVGYCKIFDESKPLAYRVSALRELLLKPDGAEYLALAKQFFEKNPPQKYKGEARSEFEKIAADALIRKRFENALGALSSMPEFAYDLVEVGREFSWLSESAANEKKKLILTALINQGSLDAKDFVCSHERWPQISARSLRSNILQNANSLFAMACLDMGVTDFATIEEPLTQALKSNDAEARRFSAWLLGAASTLAPNTQAALVALRSDSDRRTRETAVWALQKNASSNVAAQKAFLDILSDSKENESVRRNAAMGLLRAMKNADASNDGLRSKFEAFANDHDRVVRQIIENARVASNSTPIWKPAAGVAPLITQTGDRFEQVKNQDGAVAWKDMKTNHVWRFVSANSVNHYEAEMQCLSAGGVLPSKTDFALLEQHGLREVLSDARNRWFWSSSAGVFGVDAAYGYSAFSGEIGVGARDTRYGSAVVCIEK